MALAPSMHVARSEFYQPIAFEAHVARFRGDETADHERALHKRGVGLGVLFIHAGSFIQATGAVVVPRRIVITVLMSGSSVDLSQATFVHPLTDIHVCSVLGSVRISLPPGVRLQSSGVGILGGFSGSCNAHWSLDAPVVRLTGVALLGAVKSNTDDSAPAILVESARREVVAVPVYN